MTDGGALDTNRPSKARIYDYFLGGKDNYPSDRAAAAQVEKVFPNIRRAARENRDFMVKATKFIAGERGIRRFLDLGTGIPTAPNLHQVVREIQPDSRILYVDNDPVVLAHSRALGELDDTAEGLVGFVDIDLADVDRLIESDEFRNLLDEPVGVSCFGILHFFPDPVPYTIVDKIMAAVPAGSYLSITHATPDLNPALAEVGEVYRNNKMDAFPRTYAEISHFFRDLDLIDPGVVVSRLWPTSAGSPAEEVGHAKTAAEIDAEVAFFCGVARKP
ncbi:SAM-dependent methyltransferase [Nocardia miyunensis]|uniref:SAM-dependent methyltransferase n=1 Tax=Nocardia miyunensis TaxID=282684 RepID=UPI000837073F|nr:SAM-dependent methyltransferase [Nocardia miyunensis]